MDSCGDVAGIEGIGARENLGPENCGIEARQILDAESCCVAQDSLNL